MLREGLSDDAIERFRREVRLTRRIQHRNVARMFDIGEHRGDKFLTMELVDGGPLTRELAASLSWPRLQALAIQLCAGLAAAHEAGVVHRDLKPDNVLIERGTDRAVLTDFGIARSGDDAGVTQVGVVIGTPRYMAPEQLAGMPVDARADLFSLGVMLFEMATGARPWSGDNPVALAVAQATQPPRPFVAPAMPAELGAIVARCIELDRERRPQTAAEIGAVIAACAVPATLLGVAPSGPRPPPTAPSHTGVSVALAEETTLAVLPLTCAPADDYLAEGVREELVDLLSGTPTIRVRPAGLVRAHAEQDPRELGRQLEVDHVVSGSLRRTPAGLRVAARLISVADGFQIWAHRVDCAEAEVLAVGDVLMRGIAGALSTRASASSRPIDPRAVELYLRARAELRRFWGEHAVNAADLLEQALSFAPSSPQLLSTFAYAAAQAWIRTGAPDRLERALVAAERGLSTGHGEAYLASAVLKLHRGELEAAATELGLALTRAPMSAQAHENTGRLLVEIGAAREGRRHFETALGLDPGRAQMISVDLARLDALEQNWVAADQRIALLLADADRPLVQLGAAMEARLALWRRDIPRALAAVPTLAPRIGMDGGVLGIYMRWRDTGAFDPARWGELIATHVDRAKPQRVPIMTLQRMVELAVLMAQPAAALASLRAATDLGLIDTLWFEACPLLADLSAEPGFHELRRVVADRAARLLAAFRAATR